MRVTILSPIDLCALKSFLVSGSTLPTGMGGYNVTNYICERVSRKMETDVITLIPDQSVPIKSWAGGSLRVWSVRRRLRGMCRDLYRQEAELLARALAESKPDVIHVNWTYEYALGAIRFGRPFLLTVHDHAARVWIRFPLSFCVNFLIALYVMRRATHLSAVSPYIASFVARVTGRSVSSISNCFRSEQVQVMPENCPGSSSRVICSALNWSRLKNVKNALRAFQLFLCNHPRAVYHLMGPGLEENGPACQWATASGVIDGVQFLGNIPHGECLEEIRNSRLYFHPSLEESFGMSVCEAALMMKPVVFTHQAKGCVYCLNNGDYGFGCNGYSAIDMANALDQAYVRGPEASYLNSGREHVMSLCNPDTVISQYQMLYDMLSRERSS